MGSYYVQALRAGRVSESPRSRRVRWLTTLVWMSHMRFFVGRERPAGNQLDWASSLGTIAEGRDVTVELRSMEGWIQGWARQAFAVRRSSGSTTRRWFVKRSLTSSWTSAQLGAPWMSHSRMYPMVSDFESPWKGRWPKRT